MVKKIFYILLTVTFSLTIFSFTLTAYAEQTHQYSLVSYSAAEGEDPFDGLNYGFYWVTKGNEYHKANDGQDKKYYDNKKPTIIFIHGYQADVGHYERVTLSAYDSSYIASGDTAHMGDYWIDKGYNVLMYYWNQLCDEPVPWNVEPKIWSMDGPLKMRWRQKDGSYTAIDDESNPQKSMAELFLQEYLKIFNKHKGEEIRLVGHSLGGMLSIAVMGLMHDLYLEKDIDAGLIPIRLSLIDPYLGLEFTSSNQEFTIPWKEPDDAFRTIVTKDIRLVCKDYIKKLHGLGVAIDYYYATLIGKLGLTYTDNEDFDISPYITLVDYYSTLNPRPSTGINGILGLLRNTEGLHCEVNDYYLYSINFNPPKDISYDDTNNIAISASTPTSYVYSRAGLYYRLSEPDNTLSAQDDCYFISSLDTPKEPLDIKGRISGFVFEDKDRSGTRNSIKGYEGIEINLFNKNNKLISTTWSDATGFYSFDMPTVGEYYVVFDKAAGTSYSVYTKKDDRLIYDFPSDIDDEGKSQLFAVVSPYSNIVINAGIIPSVVSKIIIISVISVVVVIGGIIFAIYLRPNKAKGI